MNEQIRAIAEQAAYDTRKEHNNAYWRMQDEIAEDATWREKFAELIVFECVNAVMDGTKEGDHYAQRIEQHFDHGTDDVLHFGIEE